MALQKPTLVIFDMDGTTVRHIHLWLLHILEWMDDQSYKFNKVWDWAFRRGAKGPMPPILQESDRRKPPKLLVHRAIHSVRRKEVDQIVEPSPGVYELLDFLKAHDVPVALVSNGLGKGYGHDILEKFDLVPYFSSVIFREDIHKSKPNPECLLLTLDNLKIKPKKDDVIWFIGDRHKDILAAVNLRKHVACEITPIAYSVNSAVEALKQGLPPENIIMSYYDMHDRLKELMGNPPAKKPKAKKTQSKAKG